MTADAQRLKRLVLNYRSSLDGKISIFQRSNALVLDIDLYGQFDLQVFGPSGLEGFLERNDLYFGETREEDIQGHKHVIVEVV